MTGRRAFMVAALAAAAVMALGAALPAEAHPNPAGNLDSANRPHHSEADQRALYGSAHRGHAYPDWVNGTGYAEHMMVYHYHSCWDFTAREPHAPTTIAVDYGVNSNEANRLDPDGFQTVVYKISGTKRFMKPSEDYYVQAADGGNHCYRSPTFWTPADGAATRHYMPWMEITAVSADSVTLRATFKHSGTHTFAVSDSESFSDVLPTADVPHVTAVSSGAVDVKEVTITGLDDDRTYYVFASNAAEPLGATSSWSESFHTEEYPELVLGPLPPQQIDENVPFAYELPTAGGNPSGADYAYSISPSDAGASVNDTGHFNWTPTEEQGGRTHEFNVTLSNEPFGGSVTETLSVEVLKTNTSPVIEKAMGLADESAVAAYNFWPGEDNTYEFPFEAQDTDTPPQAVTFAIAEQSPEDAGAVINPLTGTLRWTAGAAGDSVNVTVVATDDSGTANAASAPFNKTLVAAPLDSELRFVTDRIRSIFAEVGQQRTLLVPTAGGNPNSATFVFDLDRNTHDDRLARLGMDASSFTTEGRGVGILPLDVPDDTTTSREWLRIDVSNGTDEGQELSLRINLAPAENNTAPALSFHPAAPYEATVGEPFRLFAGAADRLTQDVVYGITSHDAAGAGPSIDPSFGLIEWTPEAAGTFSITVNATDDHAADPMHAMATVTVEVAERPPPAVTGITALEGGATIGVDGHGREVQARLTDSGGTAVGNASANGTSAVFVVAGLEDGATYFVQIRTLPAGWGAESTLYYRYTHPDDITPAALISNDPPEITTVLTGHMATAGTPFALPLAADDDQAGDTVEFAIVGETLGASIASAGDLAATFTWEPNSTHVGSQAFMIRATDSDGQTDAGTLEVEVAAATQANQPPRLTSDIGPLTVAVGQQLAGFDAEATDDDGDDAEIRFMLDWGASGPPAGATFDDETGVLEWTPAAGQNGTYAVTLTATDGTEASAPATVMITVEPAGTGQGTSNRPPAFDSVIGTLPATVGQPLAGFDGGATDPDAGDTLTYGLAWDGVPAGAATPPTGADFDSGTGALAWTPQVAGTYTVTLSVTDGVVAAPATQTVTITVAAADNQPPRLTSTIGNLSVAAGQPLAGFDAEATDDDGDDAAIRFALDWGAAGAPAGATFDDETGVLSWTPAAGQAGEYAVSVTATDGTSSSAPEAVTITVVVPADVNDRQSAAEIAAVIAAADDGATVTFAPGRYVDKGQIAVANDNVTLTPAVTQDGGLATEQAASSVTLEGTTSLFIQEAHVEVHGFDFEAGASGASTEAVRANVTEGLSIRDNTFDGYLSGVAIMDDADVPYEAHPEWDDQANRDVCLMGLEACPERTSAAGRAYAGHVVSSTAEVTENTFTNMGRYTVANLADGALNAKRNHHGGGTTFGGVIVEPWYSDTGRTEPAVLGGDGSGTGSGPATAGLSLVGGTGDGDGTGAPAPAPAPAPPRRSGGGGGGGGGGGPAVIAGSASDVYISSVEWDCTAGTVSIAAGPDSGGIAVTVRTPTLGVRQAEATGSAGGLRTFEAEMAAADTLLIVQAISLRPGATLTASESIDVDECAGSAEFDRAPAQAPAARPTQPPPDPTDGAPAPQPPAEIPPPPEATEPAPEPAPEPDTAMPDEPAPSPDPEPAPSPAPAPEGGGCLIATAAHGTEMAGQIQALRQVRDGAVMQTGAGASFMAAFNAAYYSFSPAVADLEREHPLFREAVRAALAPMLHSMSLMSHAEPGSERSVLALGLSVIALNLGMYVAAPAAAGAVAFRRLGRRARAP